MRCLSVSKKDEIRKRVLKTANVIIKNKLTVRAASSIIGVSKSTIYKDVTERLMKIDYNLYIKVNKILQEHKKERHIKGGLATKRKYENLKS